MPRSPGPERQSVPPPGNEERTTERRLIPSQAAHAPPAHPSMAAESTRDVNQEDFLFHLYRGSELLQENRVLEAKEELEFALTMQPSDPKGQDLLGAVYFRLGLYPRAIQIYEELEHGFPNDASIKINVALCYLKTGQPEAARRSLLDATRINPEHRRAWGYLGLALQKLGELEQAQIAFERGGHAMMARRVTERRGRVTVPAPAGGGAGIDEGVRSAAEAAFSELDAGELRFALAEPAAPRPNDAPWHTLEPGDAGRGQTGQARTQPPPPVPGIPSSRAAYEWAALPPSTTAISPAAVSTRLVPPPPAPDPEMAGEPPALAPPPPAPLPGPLGATGAAPTRAPRAVVAPGQLPPSLLDEPAADGASLVATYSRGVALARVTEEQPFAARLESLRVVAGTAATRLLHRRARDADTSEVLGGIGSPVVRITGSAQLVLGARPSHEIAAIALRDELAFVREELLLGFELRLSYENGRLALEASPDGAPKPASVHGAETGAHVVQLRGTGTALLELTGPAASVACAAGRPVLVRREWIVAWLGRLVPRALPPGEAPSGQRGLIAFSGEGTVLVCTG